MRASILLLPGSARGESACACAEQILIDVSAAFGHVFSLLREKIGEKSLADCGQVLPDKTVAACQDCGAVFLGDSQCPGTDMAGYA